MAAEKDWPTGWTQAGSCLVYSLSSRVSPVGKEKNEKPRGPGAMEGPITRAEYIKPTHATISQYFWLATHSMDP